MPTSKPKKWADIGAHDRAIAIRWNDGIATILECVHLIQALGTAHHCEQLHCVIVNLTRAVMAPYDLNEKAAQERERAERQKVAEAIVRWGESVARIIGCATRVIASACQAPIIGHLTGDDVVEMTAEDFRKACEDRYGWYDNVDGDERYAEGLHSARAGTFTFISSDIHPHLNKRNVVIVPARSA